MYNTCNRADAQQLRETFQKFGPFGGGKFGHFGGSHKFGKGQWHQGFRRPKYNVPVNIAETATGYEVHVYALGFDKENIKIAVTDGVLYISGTRTVDEAGLPKFSTQEYPVKSFERSVSLSENIDTTNIAAKQENGVLIVTLPKTAEAQKPAQEVKID